jgi:Skp family chaperone for outer membrane proteins
VTMKSDVRISLLTLLSLAAAGPALAQPTAAPAAPQPNWGPALPGVCVLDGGRAIRTSQAGAAATQQITGFSQQATSEVTAQRDALVRDDKALTAAKPTLPPAEFDKRVQALRQRQAALQHDVQVRNAQLETTRNQANARITQVMAAAATEVVGTRHCSIVFDRGQLFATNPAMDITDAVVQIINIKMPSLQVTLAPRPGAPPAAAPAAH